MFIDARRIPERADLETDVRVVGAGAARITMAREFSGGRLCVALIENGGINFDTETQAFYNGEAEALQGCA